MKVHRYQVGVYESMMDFAHDCEQIQDRLYVPKQGVFAYRSKEQIDFFSDDQKIIEEAKEIISGKSKLEGDKYLGQVELPDDSVLMVVSAGKALNAAREVFNASSKTLVDLLPK